MRNLGIVDGFDVVQRRGKLRPSDFVWQSSEQPEPSHLYDTSLFKHRLIRLRLRTDLFSPQPSGGLVSGEYRALQRFSARAEASAPPPLAPVPGLLPLSTRNISRASQPVLMHPQQLEAARQRLPAGVLVCYHPELGLTTDAAAELQDVPLLVAAHVELPLGLAVAIRGALRAKAREQAGTPLRHMRKLKVRGRAKQSQHPCCQGICASLTCDSHTSVLLRVMPADSVHVCPWRTGLEPRRGAAAERGAAASCCEPGPLPPAPAQGSAPPRAGRPAAGAQICPIKRIIAFFAACLCTRHSAALCSPSFSVLPRDARTPCPTDC